MFQAKISAIIFTAIVGLMGFAYFSLSNGVAENILATKYQETSISSHAVSSIFRDAEVSLQFLGEEISRDPKLLKRLKRFHSESPSLTVFSADGVHVDHQKTQENYRRSKTREKLWEYLSKWRDRRISGVIPENSLDDSLLQHRVQLKRDPREWFGQSPNLLLAYQNKKTQGDKVSTLLLVDAEESQGYRTFDSGSNIEAVVTAVKEQRSAFGSIVHQNKDYLISATPIVEEGSVIAVIVMGYLIDAQFLARISAPLMESQSLLLVQGPALYAEKSISDLKSEFSAHSYAKVEHGDNSASLSSDSIALSDFEIGVVYWGDFSGQQYLLQKVDLRGHAGSGLYIFNDHTAALDAVNQASFTIPMVGFLILIALLIGVLLFIQRFLKPFEEIDAGIREIMEGDKGYVFQVENAHPLYSELAVNLNNLSNFLQGKGREEEEGDWDQLMVDIEPERPSIYGMQAIQPASESPKSPEDQKLTALYDKYMRLRKEHEQHVEMDFERFLRRIKRNEESLKKKHGCKSIEFKVAVNNGKVVLKPKLHYN